MTTLQTTNKTIRENPNIVGSHVGSWAENLVCVMCDEIFQWNTIEKFYLLNSHGWGFCQNCFKRLK